MKGKIALEEHFAIPETLQDSAGFVPGDYWKELSARILDIHDRRLREMMLLSLNAPAVQEIPDIRKGSEMARRANDYLAAEVSKRPDRFQGFAALPMQDPEQAARELTRCITELGFKGALVNGFSQAGDGSEIEAIRIGLPDVENCALYGVAPRIEHAALHQ
jgi:predicted TIM-barrel fold metal-dependent hydrolase